MRKPDGKILFVSWTHTLFALTSLTFSLYPTSFHTHYDVFNPILTMLVLLLNSVVKNKRNMNEEQAKTI